MSSARSSAPVRVPAESNGTVTQLQEKREVGGKERKRREKMAHKVCTEAEVVGIDSC